MFSIIPNLISQKIAIFGFSCHAKVIAKFRVDLNPKTEFTRTILKDQIGLCCIHFGFGSNYISSRINKVDPQSFFWI